MKLFFVFYLTEQLHWILLSLSIIMLYLLRFVIFIPCSNRERMCDKEKDQNDTTYPKHDEVFSSGLRVCERVMKIPWL